MAANVRHWIMQYLTRVAEEHGSAYWKEPVCLKTVQIIKVTPFRGTTWALISDKKNYMYARLSDTALSDFRNQPNIGHKRITECQGTLASIQFELKLDYVVVGGAVKNMSNTEHLLLDVKNMHISGAFGMSTFGDPEWVEEDKDIKLWVQGLRRRGTSGNVLKQRREQREKEQHAHRPIAQLEQTQLPWDEQLNQERENWEEFEDPRVFKLYAQPPPEDVEMLDKLNSRPRGVAAKAVKQPGKSQIKDALASPLPSGSVSQSKSSSQNNSQNSYRPGSSRQQATPLPSPSSDQVHSSVSSPERLVNEQDWPPSSPSPRDQNQPQDLIPKISAVSQEEVAQTRYPTAPPSSGSSGDSPKTTSLDIPEPTTSQPNFPGTSQMAKFIPTPPLAQPKTVKPCPKAPPVTPAAGVHLQKRHGKIVFEDHEEARSTQSSHQGVPEEHPKLSSLPTVASLQQSPINISSRSASKSRSSGHGSLRTGEPFFAPSNSETQPSATHLHDSADPPQENLPSLPPSSSQSQPPFTSPPNSLSLRSAQRQPFFASIKRVVPPPKVVPRYPEIDVVLAPNSSQSTKTPSQEQPAHTNDAIVGHTPNQNNLQEDKSHDGSLSGLVRVHESIRKSGVTHSVNERSTEAQPVSSACLKGSEKTQPPALNNEPSATTIHSLVKGENVAKSTLVPQVKRVKKKSLKHGEVNILLTDYAIRRKEKGKYPKITNVCPSARAPRAPGQEEVLHDGKWSSPTPDLNLGPGVTSHQDSRTHLVHTPAGAKAQPRVGAREYQGPPTEVESETKKVGGRPESEMTNDGKGDGHRVHVREQNSQVAYQDETLHVTDLTGGVDGDSTRPVSAAREPMVSCILTAKAHEVKLTEELAKSTLVGFEHKDSSNSPLVKTVHRSEQPVEPAGPDTSTAATIGNPSQKLSDLDDVDSGSNLPEGDFTSPIKSQEIEEYTNTNVHGTQTTTYSSWGSNRDEYIAVHQTENAFELANSVLSRGPSRSSASSRVFKPRSQETDIAPDSQPEQGSQQQPGSEQVPGPSFLAQTKTAPLKSRYDHPPTQVPGLPSNLNLSFTKNEERPRHSLTSNHLSTAHKDITDSLEPELEFGASSSRVTLDLLRDSTSSAGQHDPASWKEPAFMRSKGKQRIVKNPLPTELHKGEKRKRVVDGGRGVDEKKQRHDVTLTMRPPPSTIDASSPSQSSGLNLNVGQVGRSIPLPVDSGEVTDVDSPEPAPVRMLLGGLGGNIRQNTPTIRTASYAELKDIIYRTGVFRELAFVPP